MTLTDSAKTVAGQQRNCRGSAAARMRNGKKSASQITPRHNNLALAMLIGQFFNPALSSSAEAQTSIPVATDIGTYLNGSTSGTPNWSEATNSFQLNSGATWNNSVSVNTVGHSVLSIEGNGNTVTRAANNVFNYNSSSINNNSVTLSNLTFGQTTNDNQAIFYNTGGTRTSNIFLNNVTFNGLTGAFGNVFYLDGTTGSSVVNVTAGTGDNKVTFRNNVSNGDGAGVLSMRAGTMVFNGEYVFDSNSTENYGGAIAMYQNNGELTFNGQTTFNNNYATRYFGGAIDIWGGASTLTFNESATFTRNHVETASTGSGNPRGGAINVGYTSPGSGASVVRFNGPVTFDGNYVASTGSGGSAYGGAISAYGNGNSYNYRYIFGGPAIFQNNVVAKTGSGSGSAYGGAIYYDASGALLSLSSGTQFLNNSATGFGGAIYLQSGTISLTAATDNILFQGNRHGVQVDGAYVPIAGTGMPNGIYLGSSGTLNLSASAGYQIQLHDPIASVSGSTVTVNKTGAGDVVFYGDNGASSNYDANITANTTVQDGKFILADGVKYGNTTSGTFTVAGGALQGDDNTTLRALNLTVQNGGQVQVNNGLFTLDATNINFQGGAQFSGSGTLASSGNINLAGTVLANIASGSALNVTGRLAGTGGLNVQGGGTLQLSSSANSYTGTTNINTGSTLAGTVANAFASSGNVVVDGTLDMSANNLNQTAQNLSGAGSILLGSGTLTASGSTNTTYSGGITGAGSLTKSGTGTLTLSGTSNSYGGGTMISAGTLRATNSGALGTGALTNNGTLQFDFADADSLANRISGTGTLLKTGAGTATLTSVDSAAGTVNVNGGTLHFDQEGVFAVANNMTTASDATTTLGANAQLQIGQTFTQAAGSTLNVDVGSANSPLITARSASVSGSLHVAGFSGTPPDSASELDNSQYTILHTTNGITGTFSAIDLSGASGTRDYLVLSAHKSTDNLDYNLGFGLAWYAGTSLGNGTFTLTAASDTFNVDTALSDQAASTTGWNGKNLTKAGAGTLTLSAKNTYTGQTAVNAGTLSAGIADAFATSSAVSVASGATLALNNFSQTAKNLSGAGTINLGTLDTTTLTANNTGDTAFSGVIGGVGKLTKTGTGALTLSGTNTYSGGTTVSGGRLVATGGNSLGTGAIANNATLQLDFSSDSTLANALSGTGSLTKTGTGTATVSTPGSQGAVSVEAGTLRFGQTGAFNAASFVTASGGTTAIDNKAQLSVTNAFTQASGSSLDVAVGTGNNPAVTAGSATLAGTLTVSGYTTAAPATASALANTLFRVIHTTGGITGDFTAVDLGDTTSAVDYLTFAGRKSADNLDYNVGYGLTWQAGTTLGNGLFTLTNTADRFNADVVLADQTASATGWNGHDLTKAGAGTLTLSAKNTYTGLTTVSAGTLAAGIADAFASSSAVSVDSGATLALNNFSQTANNLSGAGTITLGSLAATVLTANNASDTEFSGIIGGAGKLTKTGTGALTLSGTNTYTGGTTLSDGTLIATSGSAMGTGSVTNNAALQLDFASDGTVANALSGTGSLTKTGTGTTTLTGGGTQGTVAVDGGTLRFAQTGIFNADSLTTASGATTTLDNRAQLSVANAFTQASGSILNVAVGPGNNPAVTAGSAALAGTLNITGYTTPAPTSASALADIRYTVLHTTDGITGDFSAVDLGGAASTVDYLTLSGRKSADNLDYNVGFGLTWQAGTTRGNGVFTLTNATDNFNADVVLADQAASATGWNGKNLTKAGDGTLTLSAKNTYTGLTTVSAGTLAAGIADAFASSGAVSVASGATLALNDFSQTARNLSGAGTISLGSLDTTVLTANNTSNTAVSGIIGGAGKLAKTGTGTLTLSGANTYTGGTTVSDGRLVATNASAMGTGAVTNNAALQLDFASDGTLSNTLSGTGSLIKTGTGAATVGAVGTQGAIAVNTGTLRFGQTGTFTAGSVTTASGATTAIDNKAQLNVANAFTQASDSTLSVALGASNEPAVTAGSATLAGTLNVSGYTVAAPVSASALAGTHFTILHTTDGITGDFATVNLGDAASAVDYLTIAANKSADNLDYSVGYGLTWLAGKTLGNGVFTLADATDAFNVDVVLADQAASATKWNGKDLTKAGDGTLTLSAKNTYTGLTAVNAGTLATGIADAFATSSAVSIASGATLAMNDFSQTARNLSGAGTISTGTLDTTVLTANNAGDTAFSGIIGGAGKLTKTGTGALTLAGANTYTGGTTISGGTLVATSGSAMGTGAVANNAALQLAFASDSTLANTISGTGSVSKTDDGTATLTGTNTYSGGTTISGGTLIATSGSAMGTGAVANNAALQLAFASDSTLANALSGTGSLTKSGTGTATLTGGGTQGTVAVNAGTLRFGQTGIFNADGLTTASGATTTIDGNAQLNVTNALTQATGSTLSVALGANNDPAITAASAALAGTLNISGYTTAAPATASALADTLFRVIHTTGGITGDFTTVNLGGAASAVDYLTLAGRKSADNLDYNVGFGLTWQAGTTLGNGLFTLTNAADAFNVDVVLADQAASATGWNGHDLTKAGAGTLTLSAKNTYTGLTTVNAGTLATGVADAFATSSAVSVASGATLAMNDFSQTARNLSGAGAIATGTLDTTVLTANNTSDTTFSGVIGGAGQLTKTGTGALTLSGTNTYTGGTTVSDGRLIATSGSAMGTGAVANNAALQLDFASDSTLANALSGTGSLTKTGTGTATLTGGGTQGTVAVNAGTLNFAQDGVFTANSLTTAKDATTAIDATAQLNVANAFTQAAGSTLSVAIDAGNNAATAERNALLASSQPVITAKSAALAGTLSLSGYTTAAPTTASALTGTHFTVLHTADGITGDFSAVDLGGAASAVDYLTLAGRKSADNLDYNVGFGLTWQAGPTMGNGAFTLTGPPDAFNVDVVLADQASSATGWNGKDLTKAGDGTLTLSAKNTYTGLTTVSAGTLATGIADAFASSGAVSIASGATLALNDFSQTANNLSGAGTIATGTLDTTVLTANNTSDTTFSGVIGGAGTFTKTGTGALTLSGSNTYTGGTTLSDGRLVATSGSAMGTGSVTNNAALQLAFADDSTLANALSGTGSLTKSGTGTATLTGGGTQGTVAVDAGTLRFGQTGIFNAESLSTASGATTAIDATAQLNVADAFTQTSGSTLSVAIDAGSNAATAERNALLASSQPVITAKSAALAGTLSLSGYTTAAPTTASALTGTLFRVIHTTGGITGDFTTVNLGGAASAVDYLTLAGRKSADNLDYNVGFGLTWQAGTTLSNGLFTLTNATDAFNVDVVLADQAASATEWNGHDLTKAGDGTLTLSAKNTYTGLTTVSAGTLATGIADAFATSSAVTVNTGATLAMNDFSQTARNLSGAGTVSLGSLDTTVLTANNTSDTAFSGVIGGAGTLTKTGTGALTLSGSNTYTGGTTLSDGTLIATSGSAMGTGSVANTAALQLDFASDSTLANALSGTGSLTKTGAGTATLTGGGTQGTVAVNAGTLRFGQTGTFNADSLTTAKDATTAIDATAQLNVADAFTQASGSTLSVAIDAGSNAATAERNALLASSQPVITAKSAALAGTLSLSGYTTAAPTTASALTGTHFTVLHTTDGITGDFSAVDLGGATSAVDYLTLAGRKSADNLDYNVGFGLTWQAGPTMGNGAFTLTGPPDAFNVDVVLADQAASATGWNGKDLTKAGAGTLTLSAKNTYTGLTTISAGTLATGIADAFASSSAVSIASGATLAMNDFSQTTNNLSGAGTITLGSLAATALTANNTSDTAFSGVIGGAGTLTKTGTGALTLSGSNTYTGGTTLSDGTLIATSGGAMGTGAVANNAALQLAFADDSTLANALSGTGSLTKSGTGTATLTGGGTQGTVAVNAGTLYFAQDGAFTADSLTTASGATTAIDGNAQLNVANALTQDEGSTLGVALGANNNTAITATSATLAGTLNITGFSASAPNTASALTSTLFRVIHTTDGITGDFTTVNLGGAASAVDYLTLAGRKSADNLDYNVGFGLTWQAGTTLGNGLFTLTNTADAFNVDVVLADQAASATGWNGHDLTKAGDGTLTLSAKNTYTGLTTVNAGTLATGVADAFATSSAVSVASGATLALNDFSQTARNLSGAGTIATGTLDTTVLTANNTSDTEFSGIIGGAGTLTKTGTGALTLSGSNTYTGGTTLSDGTLIATSGSAMGTGSVTNNAALQLDFADDSTLANALSGTGSLTKTGTGTATLTGGGTQGTVAVNAGTLYFAQDGAFTADSLTTASGATTAIDGNAQLNVANALTQDEGSTLGVALGANNNTAITATSATLAGTLNITGFSANAPNTASALTSTLFRVIHTTDGITGDFTTVNLGGAASAVDYLTLAGRKSADNLDYNVGFGLTWQAGTTLGNGLFTLTNTADAFNVDVVLADQAASATGWNGHDLTKAGDGTLTLSAKNTYTGLTTVSAGTLATGIADAFASSGAVSVSSGATLALNDFSQTARNLSGAGTVSLGSLDTTVLTANNTSDTEFSGIIGGAGQLTKTGTGALTLSGSNTYTGGTTLSDGTLIATSGSAMGTGAVANNAALQLAFADDSTLANALSGTGSLTKTGAGTATLTGGGTQGTVAVDAGTLRFAQDGVFTADGLSTASGATTTIDGNAQLNVANALTQATGSTLGVALGANNDPAITAASAALAGTLNITGFSASAPNTASALTSTLFRVIHTTDGITGDFTTVNLGGAASAVDYLTLAGRKSADNLDYNVGFGLTWQAGTTLGNGLFTLTNTADAFNVDVVLADQAASATGWNGHDLTKAGDGTLTLSAKNTYTGLTTVNAGTLATGVADAFATSGGVSVASGATLAMNDFSQTARNLSGAGTVSLGSLDTTVLTANNTSDTTFSGVIAGAGTLTKTGTGALTLSGSNTYTGGTTLSDGTLIATGGSAMGTGSVTNNAALQLAFADDSTLANALSGTGSLTKSGTATATLTGGGTQSTVAVDGGTLRFAQDGVFAADSLTTASGATTAIDGNAQLNVANALTQATGSTLGVALGANNDPAITAASAALAGTLNITGFSASAPNTASALTSTLFRVIHTTGGITGDFSAVDLGGAASTVDYLTLAGRKSADNLDYNVGFGLTWQAGASLGNGVFTLAAATDTFNADVVLADQAASATGWNGHDLTKAGDGTLTLSAKNTYTGLTTVSAGTLAAGIADAFATSGGVSIASGATLAMNDFSQTANNLSGAGTIGTGTLDTTVLTANNTNDTEFSGIIGGAGTLTKTGTGALTLSGTNTYTGGTTLSDGTLIATSGSAMGTGSVANNAALQLDFASDSTLANALSGTGALTKTGTGTATLTGGGTQGTVAVNAGTLNFAQDGVFSADSLTTASGATTAIDGNAQLNVANALTQDEGSTLGVALGANNDPAITATSATLAGTLNISGYTTAAPATASALADTLFRVIHTTGGITGDFTTVNLGGAASAVDYLTLAGRKSADNLDYNVGFGLTWQAGTTLGNGLFTLTNAADAFNVDVVLADQAASTTGWNGHDLTKAGAGTLTLSAKNTYTGLTTVNAGTLAAGIADAFATSGGVSIASGATLAMNDFSQTANNLSGAGTIGTGTLDTTALTANNTSDTEFSGIIGGTGQLTKTGTGALTLSGTNTYTGGTTLSDGTLIATSGSAMGTGAVANNAALQLDFASDSTLANALSGTGSLTKTGAGTATLTGGGTQGTVAVDGGTLRFGQTGIFNADSLTTASGATTAIDGNAQLNVTNAFTQASGSTLGVALGANNDPAVTASSATLAGTLNITGFSASAPNTASALTGTLFRVIHTTDGITGDFTTVNLGGAASAVDYLTLAGRKSADNLDYNVGFGLTWQAGATLGNGVFTLAAATDTFNADVVLADQAASATGWNGKDLTKAGNGTLTLSAKNTYTGLTTVNAGTLAAGIADAFATSSAVTVNAGATLAMNDFSQTANNLSGAGTITLGSLAATALTANNTSDTAFSGVIGGAGQLTKTGTGALTLSGTNTYTGGTTVSDGRLVATSGSAMGTGAIANNAALQLDFANDSTLANALSGTGSLTKTGAGTATLTGGGTQGTVAVNAGSLHFSQNGIFTADSLTTASGATTAIDGNAQLNVANALTQATGSQLKMTLGANNSPAITAGSATLGGVLDIAGFSASAPNTASALTDLRFTVLRTTGGITGDFSSINLGSASSPVDYLVVGGRKSADNLEYNVGFGLAWRAGPRLGNGAFTLATATDTFNADVVLADQVASDTGWNGKDLTKNGTGTLTLSAKNTYTGKTGINAGTLATGIADAFATSSAVTVNPGATLALNDFSQTANNLSGAGTISLGKAAATTLTANNTIDAVFSGVIGGAGQFAKSGTGTLSLLGNNTYSGGTTISTGSLVGNATSFGTGAILNNAALIIDQPTNATLANAINGTGTFTKSGGGSLTLTGDSKLSGATSVEGGDLVVNGFLGNSAVTMQRGTALRGNGSVGQTSIVSGAKIAPGNSIGTLTVNGAYSQAGGSTYQAQVDPASTRSDRIQVNGAATLAPGAILEVAKLAPGEYSVDSNYTVLSATHGVTGTYTLAGDTGGAFYLLKDVYDANNVYLRATRVRSFIDAAGTRNEMATAGALDSMPDSNVIKSVVTGLETDDEARLAFNQLSGEIHASIKNALLGDSRQIRETAIDRIRQRFCGPGFDNGIAASDMVGASPDVPDAPEDGGCYRRTTRPAGWARVFGSWGKTAGDGNAARLSQDVAGILMGTDTTIGEQWNVGALLGYTHNGMNADARNSSASSDNYHAGIYGGTQLGPLGIRTGAAFSWHTIETHRSPVFTGYSDNLKANYNGRTMQIFGDMGYQLAMRRMNLEPFVNVAFANTRTNSFKENGGAAALAGDGNSISSTYTTLGLRGSTTIDMPKGAKLTARGMLGWQHTFGTSVPVANLSFADSNPFTVAGVPQGRNSMVIEAGLDFQFTRRASLGVVFSSRFGGGTTTQAVQGRLAIQF